MFRRSHGGRPRHHRPGGGSRGPRFAGTYINPSKFINKPIRPIEQIEFVPKNTFADFGLLPILLKNLTHRHYHLPTPVQDEAIPHILEGKDVVGLANTGSGKTAAFALPIIHRMKKSPERHVVLVIAPTRELATQIEEEFRSFSHGLQIFTALCVGGASQERQKHALARHPQVVIGTPGRLKDLFQQGVLKLNATNILVLDEVDRMLDMGFINDIRYLVDKLSTKRQTLCFSATINPNVRKLLGQMLVNPVTVSVKTSETSDHIEQDVVYAESKEHKFEVLCDLLRKPEFHKVLIFARTKWDVRRLAEALTRNHIPSEAIHGNKTQPQRQRALQTFKDSRIKVLVATDVAARGLDIPNVSHVINFDQPNTYEDYIHRIGRTGRAGKHGKALTFIGRG